MFCKMLRKLPANPIYQQRFHNLFSADNPLSSIGQEQQQEYSQIPNVPNVHIQDQIASEDNTENETANSNYQDGTIDQETQHENEARDTTRLVYFDSESNTQEPGQFESNHPESKQLPPEMSAMLERIGYLEEINRQQEKLIQTTLSQNDVRKSETLVKPPGIKFSDCVGRKFFFPFELVKEWTVSITNPFCLAKF